MFTGIIESKAKIIVCRGNKSGKIFRLGSSNLKPLKLKSGDSISLDGACFTVIKKGANWFEVEAMPETLKLTVADSYSRGSIVNLESPLKTNEKLSGHFVTGHIDFKGKIASIQPQGNSQIIKVKFPRSYSKYIALKGSIALNGVSLTISGKQSDTFSVSLIPYTIANTNLRLLKKGDPINVEIDLIARYLYNLKNPTNQNNK